MITPALKTDTQPLISSVVLTELALVSIFEVDVTSFYQQIFNTNPYASANHNQKNNPNHKTNPKKTLILPLKEEKVKDKIASRLFGNGN